MELNLPLFFQDTTQAAVLKTDSLVVAPKPIVWGPNPYLAEKCVPDKFSQTAVDSSWLNLLTVEYEPLVVNNQIDLRDFNISIIQKPELWKRSVQSNVKEPVKVFTEKPGFKFIGYENLKPKGENFVGTDWVTVLLIGILLIIAWLKVFYSKSLTQNLQSAFDLRVSNKVFTDINPLTKRVGVTLNFVFLCLAALLSYFVIKLYGVCLFQLNSILNYLVIFGVFSILYLAKYLGFLVLQWILKTKVFLEYHFIVMNINKVYGLTILPLLICLPYIDSRFIYVIIYLSIALFGLFYLWRLFLGILLTIKIKLSIFYLILYICTLEIIPMLAIYKIVNLLFS